MPFHWKYNFLISEGVQKNCQKEGNPLVNTPANATALLLVDKASAFNCVFSGWTGSSVYCVLMSVSFFYSRVSLIESLLGPIITERARKPR